MKPIDPALQEATRALLETIAQGKKAGLLTQDEAWRLRSSVLQARDRVAQDLMAAAPEAGS